MSDIPPAFHVDWTELPLMMTRKGYALLFKKNRYIIHRGGSGSSKSYSHAQKILYYTTSFPGRNTLVTRKVGDTNRISTFALLKQVISAFNLSPLFKIYETDMTIKCINGNMIIFKGLDDKEKIKSVTFERGILTDIWMEEASEFIEEDFDQLDLRLRGQSAHSFQITLTFNPIDLMHWIKRKFYDETMADAICVLSTYKDNQFIDEPYKAKLESLETKNPYLYQVYACGEWGNAGDIVFQNARYERCPYKEEDFDEVLIGMDFGYEHYHAIEKIGLKDGRMYSFAELYVNKKNNLEIIALNERLGILGKEQLCTADSAEPKSISDWRQAGYTIDPAKKGKDSVRAQLTFLASTEWIIDPVACPGLASEVRGFSYRKDKNGIVREIDEAVGILDDGISACRYACERKLKNTKFVIW
jgi:phage terminase large subunit